MDETGSLQSEKSLEVVTNVTSGVNTKKTKKFMVPGNGNQGFAKRHKSIQDGKLLVMSGPIFCDIFMMERLLLSMVDLKVVLNRNSDKFCLMDKNANPINAKIKLVDVTLKVRKVKVNETITKAHELALKSVPATYPIQRMECKAFTIPGNIPQIRKDNMFAGIIPKTFVCGFVDADAFSGVLTKNPYNFKHFNVSSVTLTANGEEIPFKQLVLNYKDNKENFIQAYNTLFSGTGKMNYNTGLNISREDYYKGFTLYAWDLTPDMCGASPYFNTVQRGSLTLDITFAAGDVPSAPISLVCYEDFENVVQIDSERNVIYDIST
ncbi:uncharacterized protein LOC114529235 [Dendronephthya gigantea]|uniref:uncharacterized protein LOC114529235 n=1 Tax=Dendronephthya gigantea TaxID=151771 RepID=UPI00106BCD0B|nr:uncharacterized protein LOC114529235 [Dendronephthya gigantea]